MCVRACKEKRSHKEEARAEGDEDTCQDREWHHAVAGVSRKETRVNAGTYMPKQTLRQHMWPAEIESTHLLNSELARRRPIDY